MTGDRTERAKAVVRSFYEGGARGAITSFADSLDETFELLVPPHLPWGGTFNKGQYVALLPRVAANLDFKGMTYESFVAEEGHVVALINIPVRGTDQSVIISEHWDIGDNGKAVRLRVFYFDAQPLLAHRATEVGS